MKNDLSKKDYYDTDNLVIPGESIKELYESLDEEELKNQDIETFDDFYDYLKATLVSNVEYDFGTGIDVFRKNPLDQKQDYDFHNEKDFAKDYLYEKFGIELKKKEIDELAGELVDAVMDSEFLADTQGEVERQCIDEFIEKREKRQNENKTNKQPLREKEIPHIPDDQKLTVEEINAYFAKYGMFIEKDIDRNYLNFEDVEYFSSSIDREIKTKKDLWEKLSSLQNDFCRDDLVAKELADNFEFEPAQAMENAKNLVNTLEEATFGFDEKFDKCMAEFHKREAPNADLGHGAERVTPTKEENQPTKDKTVDKQR